MFLDIILFIVTVLLWWFIAGPIMMVLNAEAHSETNFMLAMAQDENESTFKWRVYQVLHCIVYALWVVGLFTLPLIIKHLVA